MNKSIIVGIIAAASLVVGSLPAQAREHGGGASHAAVAAPRHIPNWQPGTANPGDARPKPTPPPLLPFPPKRH